MAQKFLEKIIEELLQESADLGGYTMVLPGKRPVVFIREILRKRPYSGFLPKFFTVEELITEIADLQPIKGIALWLFAYEVYRNIQPSEDFANFLKWFPTLQKDWDDILKFSDRDQEVLEYLFAEERIKEWAENLDSSDEKLPRNRFLNFWRKMSTFLPLLKQKLLAENLATPGMLHEAAKKHIESFAENTSERFVFCGFNAFTPVEEKLVRSLMQWGKAQCFFHTDRYYMEDERQEAGKFLRSYTGWKEFNESRKFRWIEDDFAKPKEINVYEVSGNVSQTKLLPEIFNEIQDPQLSNTAVVLLDENLLPATLDSLQMVDHLNITMGFGLKNLSFSNAVRQLFYLQKNLQKNSSYYYKDVLPILEEIPNTEKDTAIVNTFKSKIEERNIVYISKNFLQENLAELSYFNLLEKAENSGQYLDSLIDFCFQLKFRELDDIQYENVSYFEKSFKIIKNQTQPYGFEITVETLEVLINQLINSETIDFQGEPLQGLQVMGLLETRLLNFENIILLSVNEGKLPLGNTQNTYLPFSVRNHFGLHTYLENDGIYAYHFYRLLQGAKNIHLLYNSLTSGVNTGEESRFIKQIEIESGHKINKIVVENKASIVEEKPMEIAKTPLVMEKLEAWKQRVSASHLATYIYNPIDFYLNKILGAGETTEIEEELSVRNYGNLVHYALQFLYEKITGKILQESDFQSLTAYVNVAVDYAIVQLKHLPEFYQKGMNFIHKSVAERVVRSILNYDLQLVKDGNLLEIIALERRFENIPFQIGENPDDEVQFFGFIDRIDRLNGTLRIIDYKTAKTKNLNLKIDDGNREDYLYRDDRKQALQLSIYQYVAEKLPEYRGQKIMTGIWSFAEANKGVARLDFLTGTPEDAMCSVKTIINEILNPEIPFTERKKEIWQY